jgi:hypothetical protein
MSLFDSASLCVTPNGVKEGKLYSIKPSDGSGDLSVVRATSATRVDANGLVEIPRTNLVLRSNSLNTSPWAILLSEVSINENFAISPDGTQDANKINFLTGNTRFTQSISVSQNTTYTLSFYVKNIDATQVSISIGNTNLPITNYFSQISTTEWKRVSFTFTTNTGVTVISPQITRDGTIGRSVLIYGVQLEVGSTATEYIPTVASIRTKFAGITQDGSSASNIPRLDYTNGSCPSILVEPQRTNLALRSEEFNDVSWVKIDATISANATNSPSGTLTADKLIEGSLTGQHYATRNITNQNALFSFSVFAKKSERNFLYLQAFATLPNNFTYVPFAYFNLDNGTVGNVSGATATIQDFGNGWYRCTLNCTSIFSQLSASVGMYIMTATANGVSSYLGNGTSGIFIWGAQAEAGAYPTSYIPTTSASVTRNADVISKTGISSLIGQTEGTILIDANLNVNTSERRLITISNGTETQRIFVWTLGTTLYTTFNSISVNLGNFPIGTAKIAIGYTISGGNTNYSIKVNNNALITGTAAAAPNPLSAINLGSSATGVLILTDRVNLTTIWKTRLSNTELATLTTI